MSVYVQLGVIIGLLLTFLMAISLVLIDNSRPVDNEEDYNIEIISFDSNIEFDIESNDDSDNSVLDDKTDTMSEISELSNISSV